MDASSVINSYVGRIVAFVLTPILVPTATAVAAWLQDAIGIDLTGGALTGYVVAVATGLSITAVTWLRNRGKWEVAVAEIEHLRNLGEGSAVVHTLPSRGA